MRSFHDAITAEGLALVGQLRLNQDSGGDRAVAQALTLSPAVDAIGVTDSPNGVQQMSGLAVAALLLNKGIDPVLHISSRDRNRIALKGDLLGAAALGVTSFILQRGDKLPKDVHSDVKQVFDIGAKKLLAAATQLSEFESASGRAELFIGTLATVFEPKINWQPTELIAKIDAGARFVQTQICLDLDLLRRYMRSLVAAQVTRRCNVVVSIPVLTSADSARWLFRNLRGSVVPGSVVKRFEEASDPEAFGIQFCAETLQAVQEIPGISGVNISTDSNVETIVAAVNQAALRPVRPATPGGT